MSAKDLNDLSKKRFLDTSLIDFLLQNCLSEVVTSSTNLFVGSALFPTTIAKVDNDIFEEAKTKKVQQRRVERKRASLARFSDIPVTFLMPVIEEGHFFVLEIDVDPNDADFYLSVRCYDSMEMPTRTVTRVRSERNTVKLEKASASVENMDLWFRNYIYGVKETAVKPIDLLTFHECPHQTNGHDCGLFLLGVTLHLACRLSVDKDTFVQGDVSFM